jgi:FADH2 O2-dependent halogenase
MHDDRRFGPAMLRCFELAARANTSEQIDEVNSEVLRAIDAINIAGLGESQKRNWYPVDAQDLFSAAGKLRASEEEISQLLERCGFWKQRRAAE